jgi:hypothetical protein
MIAEKSRPFDDGFAIADRQLLRQHLGKIVELCRDTDVTSLEAYLDPLRDEVCGMCDYKHDFSCACPLQALVPLAAAALEMHRIQALSAAGSPTSSGSETQKSD